MTSQTIEYQTAFMKPQFAFLAKPPPPQKRRPSPDMPLPPIPKAQSTPPPVLPVHRSPAYASILAWAAHVQPGSPGSPPIPHSPHRRPSVSSNGSRRPSISRMHRRPSISHNRGRSGSSFVFVETPVKSASGAANFDLTALGYASVFVHFPKTPTTPSPYLRARQEAQQPQVEEAPAKPLTAAPYAHIPIPPIPTDDAPPKRKGMKRFRSLTILRPKATKSTGPSSPSALSSKSTAKKSVSRDPASVVKAKQVKYKHVAPPPTLANEIALMQFAEGGSTNDNVRRIMEAQAKAAGAGGVGDAYRDGKSGLWWDADEEMEYAPLLGGKTAQDLIKDGQDVEMAMEWEAFGSAAASPLAPFLSRNGDLIRRTSTSTQDSDLQPQYILPVPDTQDDRALSSQRIGVPGMSVLALPSRPRRAALHLQKPATFLLDVAAFAPKSPRSPGFKAHTPKSRQKTRRRPAPLTLASSAYGANVRMVRRSPRTPRSARTAAFGVPHATVPLPVTVLVPSPTGVEKAKREFLENSFAPVLSPVIPTYISVAVPPPTSSGHTAKAQRRGGVRGLFSRRTEDS